MVHFKFKEVLVRKVHVNNPGSGNNKGACIMQPAVISNEVEDVGHFNLSLGNQFRMDDNENLVNGPKLFLKNVTFQLKFSGYVSNCHILVQVVRQKKFNTSYWNSDYTESQLAPKVFGQGNTDDLAGFSHNYLPKSSFEIVFQKKLWMNSKGTKNNAANIENFVESADNTLDGTTPHIKYMKVHLPINRVVKQLNSSVGQDTASGGAQDNQSAEMHASDGAMGKGSYSWNNLNPWSNYYLLISTDDTEDRIVVDILRTTAWRDLIS